MIDNISPNQMQLTMDDAEKLMELAGIARDADPVAVRKFM